MKKLELKDITGYLPYGLLYSYPEYKEIMNNGIFEVEEVNLKGKEFYGEPILRPLSDLYKEITHKMSEPFVPIEKLAKIAHPSHNWYLVENKNKAVRDGGGYFFGYGGQIGSFCLFYESNRGRKVISDLRIERQVQLFDKLHEWMIDYRGLIDAGLAIDVNTLDSNPYK